MVKRQMERLTLIARDFQITELPAAASLTLDPQEYRIRKALKLSEVLGKGLAIKISKVQFSHIWGCTLLWYYG